MSQDKPCNGCREYSRLSRRSFMGLMGGSAAAAAVPAWLPRVVLAQDASSQRDVLVHVFQRGGADALSLVVPHGDNDYYRLRPNLAVPRPDSNAAARAISPGRQPDRPATGHVVPACGIPGPSGVACWCSSASRFTRQIPGPGFTPHPRSPARQRSLPGCFAKCSGRSGAARHRAGPTAAA